MFHGFVKLLFLFLVTFAACGVQAQEVIHHFVKHTKEARSLNRARRPLYDQITNRESVGVSNGIILLENLLVFPAYLIDKHAEKYQKVGLPVFKDDFISMSETPEFRAFTPNPLPLSTYQQPLVNREALYDAIGKYDFEEVTRLAQVELEKLTGFPTYNCLTRHFLEALVRSAIIAQRIDQEAQSKNLPSPKKVYRRYLELTVFGILSAKGIDKDAAPLQARGIAIICQDVPVIPVPTTTH